MRRNRLGSSTRVDRCPICQLEVSDIGIMHINFVSQEHLVRATAECKRCEVDLFEIDGQWRTSKLSWRELIVEVDFDLANEIFFVHDVNNFKMADFYQLDISECNEMVQNQWNTFVSKIKPNDKLYTWKQDHNHGIALTRNYHIMTIYQFET